MNIFSYLSYRKFLKELVEERKKVSSKFTFAHLAEVMGIQKTYLSQVLASKADLNTDQVFLLSEYLQLSADESDYLNLLVDHSRSSLTQRKKKILQRIKERQQKHLKSDKMLNATFVEPTHQLTQTEYFLNPYNSIVHVYLTLPQFQREPFLLVKELGINKQELQKILTLLSDLKFIRYQPDSLLPIEMLQNSVHSASTQSLTTTQQILFRSITLDKLIKIPREKRYGANVTFSANYEVFMTIKNEFLEMMARCQKQVQGCDPNEVYHMSFDLFPLKEEL